jgi:hypothetical protein
MCSSFFTALVCSLQIFNFANFCPVIQDSPTTIAIPTGWVVVACCLYSPVGRQLWYTVVPCAVPLFTYFPISCKSHWCLVSRLTACSILIFFHCLSQHAHFSRYRYLFVAAVSVLICVLYLFCHTVSLQFSRSHCCADYAMGQ